ncbi:MAG TPA: response regulator transcription factor [Gemmatimonadales bacterium]|nr:response regulator transcription factor [Gemmatimonadales bacterium]
MRVLLVEDDPALAASVAAYLRDQGFAVDVQSTGEGALVEAAINAYDAIVLDLKLPDLDGIEVCCRLRARNTGARILMATARDAVEDRIGGLETGADDYLVKPYALGELAARLRALLRRPAEALPVVLRVGDLALDTGTRRARRGTRDIVLTTKEYAVLEYLMRHPGRVLTRERISEHAWDENYDPLSNVIDVYIARLRRKVDLPGEPPLLETVRGAGYRLGTPATAGRATDGKSR